MAVLYCRLAEIMARKGLRVEDVCRRCGVHRCVVVNLRRNSFEKLSRSVITRICKGLNISLDALLEVYEEDALFPVRLHRHLTIHMGCNTVMAAANDPVAMGRHTIGSWDLRASIELRNAIEPSDGRSVQVQYQWHDLGVQTDTEAIDRAFAAGDHVILGSPVSNRFTEYVVSRMFGVPPFTAAERHRFPANFVLDSAHCVPSSLAFQGQGTEFGIVSTQTGRMIARRTLVAEGQGEDCALIVVLRLFQPPKLRGVFGKDDQRVIVCALGHSGPGTLAAVRVLLDPRFASLLWPPKLGQPLMAAVSATYERAPGSNGRDNRVLTSWDLIDMATGESITKRLEAAEADAQSKRKRPPTRKEKPPKGRVRDPKSPANSLDATVRAGSGSGDGRGPAKSRRRAKVSNGESIEDAGEKVGRDQADIEKAGSEGSHVEKSEVDASDIENSGNEGSRIEESDVEGVSGDNGPVVRA